jgi:hypothetical protein
MAAQATLLADLLIPKASSLRKPLGQMNRNLVSSIYERYSITIDIANFVSIRKQKWPAE